MNPADSHRWKGSTDEHYKQLPLRPQASKPILTKYDSFSRPAPLYSQGTSNTRTPGSASPGNVVTGQSSGIYPANLMAYRPHKQSPVGASPHAGSWSSLPAAYLGTPGHPSYSPQSCGASSQDEGAVPSGTLAGRAGLTQSSAVSQSGLTSATQHYVRSHVNPYSRPISAKEVMENSKTELGSGVSLYGTSRATGNGAFTHAEGPTLSDSARGTKSSKIGGPGGDRLAQSSRTGITSSSKSRIDGVSNSAGSTSRDKENKTGRGEQAQVFCSSGGKPLMPTASTLGRGSSMLHRDLDHAAKKVAPPSTSQSRPGYYPNLAARAMMYEQRPRGDGAPAKPSKSVESRILRPSNFSRARFNSLETDDSEEDDIPAGERLPGDGAASLEDLDDEDDGIDCLEDDVCSTDGDLDTVSFASSTHSRQSSSRSQQPCSSFGASAGGAEAEPKPATASKSGTGGELVPALCPSLFPKVPPTVNFVTEGVTLEHLPWEIRKFLKWRMSPITPNIVKSVVARAGFATTKRNDWLGCWGKHMKSVGFKAIREYQKLNHFPGSFVIGRKDRLWRNLSRMQVLFGKKEFGFFPQTFVLPPDMKLLKRAFEDGGGKQKWIIKPPASARGIGIRVIHKWNQVPRKKPVVVQKYLARPYLINESKFDMRVYVYISCFDPLRLYIYEDGLARFASCKYSPSLKSLNNKFMHLTNYSVNKKNADYQSNGDENVCQGHKWSLKALWSYMRRQGVNTGALWESIKDLVVKTILSAESSINSYIKANVRSRYSVHELFGFDILLDDRLRPWILEVNISPSLHSNSPLDVKVKGGMIRDLLNMAGIRIPEKGDLSNNSQNNPIVFATYQPGNRYCMDKRLFTSTLSPDERAKHAYFCQRYQDEQILQSVLDVLTPDDTRVLIECIDEDSRRGGFERIFPSTSSHTYLRFFETPRYYNLLLDQWVQRFHHMEARGVALLESICEKGVHLQNPTNDPQHQWCPPRSPYLVNLRERDQSHSTSRPTDNRQRSAPASKQAQEDEKERNVPKPGAMVIGGVLKVNGDGVKERAAMSLPSGSLPDSASSSYMHSPQQGGVDTPPSSSKGLGLSGSGQRAPPRGPAQHADR